MEIDQSGKINTIDMHWLLIGKTSPAHNQAYKVYKRILKADKKVSFEEIQNVIKKIAGGYLSDE
ncbi:MAG TPA: hypothetical protein PLS49_05100 [Candidatus Woesebacteria bacterium]|nr:hypothetical protein [Candidatus Woesebacteria bacterium]